MTTYGSMEDQSKDFNERSHILHDKTKNIDALIWCGSTLCGLICSFIILIALDISALTIGLIYRDLSCFEQSLGIISLANYLILVSLVDIILIIFISFFLMCLGKSMVNHNDKTLLLSIPVIIFLLIWWVFTICMIGIGISELSKQYQLCSREMNAVGVMTIIIIIKKMLSLGCGCSIKCCV